MVLRDLATDMGISSPDSKANEHILEGLVDPELELTLIKMSETPLNVFQIFVSYDSVTFWLSCSYSTVFKNITVAGFSLTLEALPRSFCLKSANHLSY